MSLLDQEAAGGLNDDVLSELSPTSSLDGAAISLPKELPEVVVEVDAATTSPDEVADNFIENIGDYDVKLKTIEDDVARSHSLKDVAAQVLSSESIGQAVAENVARVLPSLQEAVAPVNRFTEAPTRTYLDKTKAFVETSVKTEHQQFQDRLAAFITRELKSAVGLYEHIKQGALETALVGLEELRKQATLDLAEASVSKSFLRYRLDKNGDPRGTLMDLRHIPITRYLPEDVPGLPECFPTKAMCDAFYSAVTHFDIRCVVTDARLALNITHLVESMIRSGATSGDRDERLPLTYMELLALLSCNKIGDALLDIANVTAQTMDAVHVNGQINEDTSALVAEIMTTLKVEGNADGESIEVFIKDLRNVIALVMLLVRFTTAINQFVPVAEEVMKGYRAVME